jgi:Phosphotransferase enzyme family
MTFLLGTQNIFTYLIEQGICQSEDRRESQISSKICKNFNLLVSLSNNRHLLLKQEPHDLHGKTSGELFREWQIHEWLREFPELSHLRPIVSEAIRFDRDSSIIIFNYLNHYGDLGDFYAEEQIFPTEIASSIGISLATIHRTTYDRQDYQKFLAQNCQDLDRQPNFLNGLAKIEPEKFATVSTDGFKFFELYQRYPNLEQALVKLNNSFQPCCLTHNDLKLNNILLHNNWTQIAERLPSINQAKNGRSNDNLLVRIIDWEKWSWGDPACDLGTLIGSYLSIWLNSLVINQNIDIATALSIAQIPLETLQPSIFALTSSYLANFPAILSHHPNFLRRVVQFVGLALIERIRSKIYYHEPFGNTGICMLEVAKTLLCNPAESIPIVFGVSESELINRVVIA